MPHIDIRFEFDPLEDYEADTYYRLRGVKFLGSDLATADRDGIAETWGQSDRYYTETVNEIIEVIGND